MKIVVKLGGSLLKEGVPGALLDDIAVLSRSHNLILAHGGGDIVTQYAKRLGKEQRFIVSPEGIRSRYTDRETADIYTMVMSGLIAKRLVLALGQRKIRAVSISGVDGGLLGGLRKKRLAVIDDRGRKVLIEGGYTGRVSYVNAHLLETIAAEGYVPVVSPVAVGEGSEPLNVDGDRAASSLAVGVSADAVVFVTNVPGLLVNGEVVPTISPDEAEAILPTIGFGMQKKLIAASEAVRNGVREGFICSGSRETPLKLALDHNGCTTVKSP